MSNSMKFEDMNEAQRRSWLVWANRHDWGGDKPAEFVQCPTRGFVMRVTGYAVGADDVAFVEEAMHKTPRELRDWAGY